MAPRDHDVAALSRMPLDRTRIAAMEAENARLQAEIEAARRVLDSATGHAVVTLDIEGRITGWNTGAQRIMGYPRTEALGRSGDMMFVPEDQADGAFDRGLDLALERGEAVTERWHVRRDGTRFWASGLTTPLRDGEGNACGFVTVLHDATAAQAEAEQRAMLLAELADRARKTLSVVQAVASQTARQSADVDAFRSAFDARLAALARSHDVVVSRGREGAPLCEVAARALAPHEGAPGRVTLQGPVLRLGATQAVMLGLAFHELATNAARYGALSGPDGRVEVRWAPYRDEAGRRMAGIDWRERGGPPVRMPARRGFGAGLLERGLPREFGGTVALDFAPEGVRCRIELPLGPRMAAPAG